MFSPSQNCRSPHVNVDVCRNDIFESELLQNQGITSTDMLLKTIESINLNIGNEIQKGRKKKSSKKASTSKEKALQKAIENNFFLGLDKAWMYRDLEDEE